MEASGHRKGEMNKPIKQRRSTIMKMKYTQTLLAAALVGVDGTAQTK
jgi:hypothetical protein